MIPGTGTEDKETMRSKRTGMTLGWWRDCAKRTGGPEVHICDLSLCSLVPCNPAPVPRWPHQEVHTGLGFKLTTLSWAVDSRFQTQHSQLAAGPGPRL